MTCNKSLHDELSQPIYLQCPFCYKQLNQSYQVLRCNQAGFRRGPELCPTDLHSQETDGGCRWPTVATIFHPNRFQKGLRLNRPQSNVQDTEALWDPRGDGTSHKSTLRQLVKWSVRWWTSHRRVQCHHGSATRRCLGTLSIHHHDWLYDENGWGDAWIHHHAKEIYKTSRGGNQWPWLCGWHRPACELLAESTIPA